jgi:phage/plasmid primase-like uncharacterized protein
MYGKDIIVCMRVTSERHRTFADGSIGYLHSYNGTPLPSVTEKKKQDKPFVDQGRIAQSWREKYGHESLPILAKDLGVPVEVLTQLGTVKAPQHDVWGFPMRDDKGHVIGIRMRHRNGRKWCEPGGHNGLFIPQIPPQSEVVICEGPTDTATALSLGLYAVGRFNCSGGVMMLTEFIKHNKIKRATIVADVDNDREINGRSVNPGIQGAMALRELMHVPTRCVTLPTKDLREFAHLGGNAMVFNAVAAPNVWSRQ